MKIPADGRLPSLPQVVLRALEACRGDSDYREIARIVSSDTALTARLLSLANSSLYGRAGEVSSIEQALLRLGTNQIESLIITASLRQLMIGLPDERWQQVRDFWRHSLTTALTARALARLTRYSQPEEAFMVGMLHNVGELFAINLPPGEKQQALLDNQVDLGVELAEQWGLGQMAVDAIRYQQASPQDVRDATHLVKLINLSTRLALSDSGGVDAAQILLGLTSALIHEICSRIDREVALLAESLDITLDGAFDGTDAHRRLFSEVVQSAMVEHSVQALPESETITELLTDSLRSLATLTNRPGLVFVCRDEALHLLAATHGTPPELEVAIKPSLSLITRTANDGKIGVLDADTATILDRQMLGLLGSRYMMCVPVRKSNQCFGVLVAGLDAASEADSHESLISLFARRLAKFAMTLQPGAGNQADPTIDQLARQVELRKRVHEINNPLAIVRQYISQLRTKISKLQGGEAVGPDLDIVREELDRAAGLLERISEYDRMDPDRNGVTSPESESGALIINDEVNSLCDLFEDALFAPKEIECERVLTSAPTHASVSRGPLRQTVMNLIRNAVESIEDGGRIIVRTEAPIWQGHRQWVEMSIEDSGTGVPESVRTALFKPVRSTKGSGHSGLGLSIVKQLIDDMEGIISCRTGENGTCFRILLPAATDKQKESRDASDA